MKSLVLLAVLVVSVLIAGCAQPTPSGPNAVTIKNFAYSPANLTVSVGTVVTWTNEDVAPHTVTSDTGSELNSTNLAQGQTYSHTFSTAGTFPYHCTIHPNMKAQIVVE
jgi:amicyanin